MSSIIAWGLGGLAVVVVLGIGGFGLAILLAARFETRHLRRLILMSESDGPSSGKADRIAESARSLGYRSLGVFRDEESDLLKENLSLHLSPDDRTLLMIPSLTRMLGYRLMTRLGDGSLLVTGETLSHSDLTGQRLVVNLPGCPFLGVLACHDDRIAAATNHDEVSDDPALSEDTTEAFGWGEVLPWQPGRVVDDLYELDRQLAARAVGQRFATWRDHTQESWRHNWRGAWKVMVRGLFGQNLGAAQSLAEAYRNRLPSN
ncbi:MAG: hypothetical protein AAGE65_05450 [Planctomycetota bacterium]